MPCPDPFYQLLHPGSLLELLGELEKTPHGYPLPWSFAVGWEEALSRGLCAQPYMHMASTAVTARPGGTTFCILALRTLRRDEPCGTIWTLKLPQDQAKARLPLKSKSCLAPFPCPILFLSFSFSLKTLNKSHKQNSSQALPVRNRRQELAHGKTYLHNDKSHKSKIALWVCECGFPNMLGRQTLDKAALLQRQHNPD